MKYVTAIILVLTAFFLVSLNNVYAEHEKNLITPYGDYCTLCSKYGICRSQMTHEQAHKALIDYYHRKGMIVEVDRKHGRFIRAKIREKGKIVDIIVFDRKSGRVRSIY